MNYFDKYANKYDMNIPEISYKYYHSYRVMDNMVVIAKSMNLTICDIKLAKCIEVTRKRFRKKVLESELSLSHALEILKDVQNGELAFDRTLRGNNTFEIKKTDLEDRLQQNIDTATLVIWNDAWINAKQYFMHKKDSIVIFAGNAKWSDYDEKNILQINKGSYITNI